VSHKVFPLNNCPDKQASLSVTIASSFIAEAFELDKMSLKSYSSCVNQLEDRKRFTNLLDFTFLDEIS